MFKAFKKRKLIREFSEQLAADLYSLAPPDLIREAREGKSKKVRKTYDRAMDQIITKTAQFKDVQKLGVYGKAKLHQVFMGRLEVLGYDQELVREVNRVLLLRTP